MDMKADLETQCLYVSEGTFLSDRSLDLSRTWNSTQISDSTSIGLYREVESDTELNFKIRLKFFFENMLYCHFLELCSL